MKRKRLLAIFLLLSFTVSFFAVFSASALSKQGIQGEEVTAIQTKLQELGYYNGKIDGIFGSGTKEALVSFQRDNALSSDGIAGAKTLKALGITQNNRNGEFSQSEIALLARIISAESRGEPYEGQVAVGAVILNRISHPSFPNTLAGVIYQPGAFSCLNDGQVNEAVAQSAERAARDAMNGWDPTGGAIYYFNPNTATSKWILSRPVITVIGSHRFCS
ncbi:MULTISPECIES: spore cortex-lytic enzyme [unclassified Ruminococcus]|uniref:spore cortex-lytic enzyme n=1 Tax=unclassified Ruminococcus TaxID=2608920 RepID=UPI00210A0417|nr:MULTISPECIES: spore cortex-lytic enzyme [unclassified Ruminococcus]MCQ4022034.1 spore cortex-lytic enzyme [Ruminococcus sp. zg-924]MCQ4114570.1 spore cortex-lytic enzyme [Ruminococcus sp. zg-921]